MPSKRQELRRRLAPKKPFLFLLTADARKRVQECLDQSPGEATVTGCANRLIVGGGLKFGPVAERYITSEMAATGATRLEAIETAILRDVDRQRNEARASYILGGGEPPPSKQ